MNATAILEYAADPAFTDVGSSTGISTSAVPELHSDLDEQANSGKVVPGQKLSPSSKFVDTERSETDTQASSDIPKRSNAPLSGAEEFYQWPRATAPEIEWTARLTTTLLDASIWGRLVRQAPERALKRWLTAKRLVQEELTQPAISTTVDADRLLALLTNAPSRLRNQIHSLLVRFCSSDEILDASLAQYKQTCQEQYLLQAISLLESKGKDAWRALRKLIRDNRCECELFIGLIARCDGVPASERVSAIKQLATNPHAEVRSALIDQLPEFDEESQRCALKLLKDDVDSEVRQEAEEYLVELE